MVTRVGSQRPKKTNVIAVSLAASVESFYRRQGTRCSRHIYTRARTHTHVFPHPPTRARAHAHTHTHTHTHMHTRTNTRTNTHKRFSVHALFLLQNPSTQRGCILAVLVCLAVNRLGTVLVQPTELSIADAAAAYFFVACAAASTPP